MFKFFKGVYLFIFLLGLLPLSAIYSFDHSHSSWDKVLKKHVTWSNFNSTVDYKSLKKERTDFNFYLEALSDVSRKDFDSWDKNQKLAFLINAYNAFTVKLILEHYPVKSIKDIGGLFSSPWKKSFFKLLGESRHLDWIEHEQIRPVFDEPRIHFAVVCASKGCPGLRTEAYVAEKLAIQLQDATVQFMSDKTRNVFDREKNELQISSIFKWYGKDFVRPNGEDQITFVRRYLLSNEELSSEIKGPPAKIVFRKYDWSLNE